MTTQIITTSSGWQLQQSENKTSGLEALVWSPTTPLREIGATDVLVKFHAAALNYRDLAILDGTYPLPVKNGVVPGADGAGEVVAIGNRVSRFSVRDKVIPFLYQTGYFGGSYPRPEGYSSACGCSVDGTFREYGVFDQEGLVAVPSGLTYEEGAVIQGPFLTAWNCYTGGSIQLCVGDYVLVQGSGIVSLAAIQLAIAAGAVVIATSSSDEKAKKLKELGVKHVINYKKDTQWGAKAKRLSHQGLGCRFVIDVAGEPNSF